MAVERDVRLNIVGKSTDLIKIDVTYDHLAGKHEWLLTKEDGTVVKKTSAVATISETALVIKFDGQA